MTTGPADHVGRNRTHWDRLSTGYAEWASEEIWRLRKRP